MAVTTAMTNSQVTLNSSTGGVILVTIAQSPVDVSPADQPCRDCIVMQRSGTQVYMNIDAAATTSHWKLSGNLTYPIEVKIDNLSKLHFIGTAADVVQIIWRN